MLGAFSPGKFPACVSQLRNPDSTILSFQSGTTVILGTKHPVDALVQLYKMLYYILKRTGRVCTVRDFRVQNVVGNAHLGYDIDVVSLARTYRMASNYEKSIFPGLHFTIPGSPIRFIVFRHKGRFVITGGKNGRDIHEAYNTVLPWLEPFIREPVEDEEEAGEIKERGEKKKKKAKKKKTQTQHREMSENSLLDVLLGQAHELSEEEEEEDEEEEEEEDDDDD